MTITETTQSTGSRAVRRIALAGGAAAIAAVAFSGAASAAPLVNNTNTNTFTKANGNTVTRTTNVTFNLPHAGTAPGDRNFVFSVSNSRTVTTPAGAKTVGTAGGFNINPARPITGSTVSVGGGAVSTVGGLRGIAIGLGIANGRIIPPVTRIP